MVSLVSTILSKAAENIINVLGKKIAKEVYYKIKGDPIKRAFKQALGKAVERYATGERLALARPLFNKHGILTDKEVAEEFAQLLSSERKPNLDLISEKWKATLNDTLNYCDFVEETRLLVSYFEKELRDSEVFRAIYRAHDLNSIADSSAQSTEALESIEQQLRRLINLLSGGYGTLLLNTAKASYGIRKQLIDYTRLIEDKTRGFVGRRWVFEAVERFMDENSRGYFFIIGDPGIGKSALSAQMVKQKGYIHHFNIRSDGNNKAASFLNNICAEIVATYDLQYEALPLGIADDSMFLKKILEEVSKKLKPGNRCVVLVDALDEADQLELSKGTNLLYLPQSVPEGIYFVVTMREENIKLGLPPRVDCEQAIFHIDHNSSDNIEDVTDYLLASTTRQGIRAYIEKQGIESQDFVKTMVNLSEGNFMYLRYVLPEIARGAYANLKLQKLPAGLMNYYKDHWVRMRGYGGDEDFWHKYKLPIIATLAAARAPVSVDLLEKFTGVNERTRIIGVLEDWAPFLHEDHVYHEGRLQKRYRFYHNSFLDFISDMDQVKEGFDMRSINLKIANYLKEVIRKQYNANYTNRRYTITPEKGRK